MSLPKKLVCACILIFISFSAYAQEKPYTVEYYYKARWGFQNEFIRLFKKNHYPVLKKEIEMGRILQVTASTPVYHFTEDGRWDYRVTIVWKNSTIAHDDFDPETITKPLYPDQETFKKEEQRRFEILLAHWDLPVETLDLKSNSSAAKPPRCQEFQNFLTWRLGG